MRIRSMFVGILGAGLLCSAGVARAQSGACTPITSVPFTINASGVYCLTGNLSFTQASGAAITVNTSGVVVDLNGFRIRNDQTLLPASTTGVSVSAGALNVVVRNGLISQFLGVAIWSGAKATIVEDVRLSENNIGVRALEGGAVVRHSYCRQNNLCIWIQGANSRVVDNDIIGDAAVDQGTEDGINVGAANVLIVGNRMSRLGRGVFFDYGGSGKYRDNLTTNVTTPFTAGGTDAGNNN